MPEVHTVAEILGIYLAIVRRILPLVMPIVVISFAIRFFKMLVGIRPKDSEEETQDDVSHMFSECSELDIDDEDWDAKRKQVGERADESVTHDHIRDISLSKEAQIKQLKTLKKAGLLSQEEYLQRLNSL